MLAVMKSEFPGIFIPTLPAPVMMPDHTEVAPALMFKLEPLDKVTVEPVLITCPDEVNVNALPELIEKGLATVMVPKDMPAV